VRTLMALTLLSTGTFAIEGAYRKLALLNTGTIETVQELAFAHDSSIFLAVVILLVLAQAVFGAPRWQRMVGISLLPVALFTLFASQRRAGIMGLLIAFLAVAVVIAITRRKAFFLLILPLLLSLAVYLPLFWNNTGTLGQPARAVRSLVSPDPRDASSNEYRDLEAINVRATIDSNPLMGVGFGQPFEFVVPLPDLSWWQFWHYEPHHNILWVWLKTGAIGFTVFWTLIGSALALAANHARRLRTPELRTFALVSIAAVVAAMAFSYVDLGLTSARVTVFIGTLLGVVSVLPLIDMQYAARRG
jgi:O-Antigen ligase